MKSNSVQFFLGHPVEVELVSSSGYSSKIDLMCWKCSHDVIQYFRFIIQWVVFEKFTFSELHCIVSDWNIVDDPFTIWGQNFIMICGHLPLNIRKAEDHKSFNKLLKGYF
jgi:hypothetical protein